MTIQGCLEAWRQGSCTAPALYRALCEHPSWRVLRTAGQRFDARRNAQGEPYLTLFHDDDAAKAYTRATGDRLEYLDRCPGHVAFMTMMQGIVNVQIDPGTPQAIELDASHQEELERWARAVWVEGLIAEPSGVHDAFQVFREYRGYQVVIADTGLGETLVMAPDRRGRRLAAIFTADDCREAFMEAQAERLGDAPRVLVFSGKKLFGSLGQQRVAGLVFNCSGPCPPRAFHVDFCHQVLHFKPPQ